MNNTLTDTISLRGKLSIFKAQDSSFDFSQAYLLHGRHNTDFLVMIFVSKVEEKELSFMNYFLDDQKIENKNIKFSISYRKFGDKIESKLSLATKHFWSTQKNAERDLKEYINQHHKEFQKLNSEKEILDFFNRPEEEE